MLKTFEAANVFENPSDNDQRDDLVLLRDFSGVRICEGKYQQYYLLIENNTKRCINRMEKATIQSFENGLWKIGQYVDYCHK